MFYQRVFEHQRLLGLKLVPKLKLAHIWPSTWQRMTVSLATQLYSKHMAMALKFLREDKKTAHLFNGSEATEKLTKLINDTFDIMNGRHKDGWRLSIRSTIDLTEELLNPKNPLEKYDFVLTAKWNQDALEMTFWAHTFSRYTSNGCKFSTYYQDDVIVHTREDTIAERKCRK
ncbi:uncharacterized protein LOC123474398 isoform X3 [Daphnia magna]|nr:uncharacterized protein LOC123474398 isoform X3 [Daphnia magna]